MDDKNSEERHCRHIRFCVTRFMEGNEVRSLVEATDADKRDEAPSRRLIALLSELCRVRIRFGEADGLQQAELHSARAMISNQKRHRN